jgi:hypothetical protein
MEDGRRNMLVINCQGWKEQEAAIEVVEGWPLLKLWDGFSIAPRTLFFVLFFIFSRSAMR